jgi:hypothetical protein
MCFKYRCPHRRPIYSFIAATFMLLIVAFSVFAQNTVSQEAASLGIKLPAWVQAALGLTSTGIFGAILTSIAKDAKALKYLKLFEDSKLVISSILEVADYVKVELKDPNAIKAWNDFVTADGQLLIDTGNPSCIQKGQFLLSKKIG